MPNDQPQLSLKELTGLRAYDNFIGGNGYHRSRDGTLLTQVLLTE
jgi:hypothetical protein